MDKTRMMERLMATFVEELEEHTRHFNQDLLALEKNPPATERTERFKTLFRTAHSLKGAARSVNVQRIETACHHVEDILTGLRDAREGVDPEQFALLFATVDAIEEAGMRLREQQDLADAPLSALLPRLEAAARGTKTKPLASTAVEAPAAPRSDPTVGDAVGVSSSVRVAAEKLDELLARVGELQIAQRRVEARLGDLSSMRDLVTHWKNEWKGVEHFFARDQRGVSTLPRRVASALRQSGANLRRVDESLDRLAAAMTGDARLLDQAARPLDDEVRRVRMLPFADACAGLDRMVRDLAQAKDKEVELAIEGGSVELDRSILEGLKDPLRHLVRNAIDHGVESPGERRQAGKPPRARIEVAAALRGGQVEVIVRDDGRGLDLEAIRAQARRRRLDIPTGDDEVARLIFQPGFSTASIVTDVSGRGVGLDVVKDRVETLHGTVELSFEPGRGSRFRLNVPLTLTTLRAVLVKASGRTHAFAATNVHKMVQIVAADIRMVAGREVVQVDGEPLPLASLSTLLDPTAAEHLPAKVPILIVASGVHRVGLIVEELVAEQEILIKSLGARVRRIPLVAGATLLPSGEVALVLNAAALIRRVLEEGGGRSVRRDRSEETPVAARKRLLVVEDSVTTRTLMKSILEAAGYDVDTAADGQSGWDFLRENVVDLVVSDVDMPRMDGFELTAAVRASTRHRDLPVVLVTARESEKDKIRGIEIRANAYIVKSAFDQRNLLETIKQML